MSKKVMWLLWISTPDYDKAAPYASYDEANAAAREALKEDWSGFEEYADDKFPGDMPDDWEDAVEAMHDQGYYGGTRIDLSHHTVETDDMRDA